MPPLLVRPQRAPDVALPKQGPLGLIDMAMQALLGATMGPEPNAQDYQTPQDYQQAVRWNAGGQLAGMVGPTLLGMAGIKAYHGSPHDFDQFSLSKIGTGEGAQAYGHGLYFAENPSVAASYRTVGTADFSDKLDVSSTLKQDLSATYSDMRASYLQGNKTYPPTPADAIEKVLNENRMRQKWAAQRGDFESYAKIGDENITLHRAMSDPAITKSPGHGYEVNIHASPDELLDWDKPLSQQPQKVQEAIKKLPDADRLKSYLANNPRTYADPTGENLHDILEMGGYQRHEVAQQLKDAGIKGIQYLDQGSRAAGSGTRNFVIFDDKIIDIAKKYGVSLPVAAKLYADQQSKSPRAVNPTPYQLSQ